MLFSWYLFFYLLVNIKFQTVLCNIKPFGSHNKGGGEDYQQQKQHIAHVVAVVGMAQHMAKEADIGEGIAQRGAVHAKELRGGVAAGHAIKTQRQQTQQCKGQHHRCIESNHKFFQGIILISVSFC